jgi:hypothetical protein
MRKIDTSKLSDECWGVQINGLQHCQNCKWIGISACAGQDIRLTGYNAKGYQIGSGGIIEGDHNPEFVRSTAHQENPYQLSNNG